MKNSQIISNQSAKSSVGKSEATSIKQKNLQSLINIQVGITIGVFKKHPEWAKTYHLFDITAGNASPNDLTSPIIFLERFYFAKIQFEAVFVEENENEFNKLIQNISNFIESLPNNKNKDYFAEQICLINGNSEKELSKDYNKENKWKFGCLYCDCNGFKNALWRTVIAFSKTWPVLDIVINISPVQINRNRGAFKKKYNKNLLEIINQINRKDIYIRDSIKTIEQNRFQHLMLLCTNYGDYKKMRSEGFYKLESKQGQKIIHSHM